MPDLNAEGVSLVSTVTVSHAAAAATTLYTVPYGENGGTIYFAWDKTEIIAAGDEAATDITLGRVGALTDFIGTTQLDNLDAQWDRVAVRPIPADPPVKQKAYPSGTILQVNVTAANGNAGNKYLTFGTFYVP
jgi:hypothetical protein